MGRKHHQKFSLSEKISNGLVPRSGIPDELLPAMKYWSLILHSVEPETKLHERLQGLLGPTMLNFMVDAVVTKMGLQELEKKHDLPPRAGKIVIRCSLEILHGNS